MKISFIFYFRCAIPFHAIIYTPQDWYLHCTESQRCTQISRNSKQCTFIVVKDEPCVVGRVVARVRCQTQAVVLAVRVDRDNDVAGARAREVANVIWGSGSGALDVVATRRYTVTATRNTGRESVLLILW